MYETLNRIVVVAVVSLQRYSPPWLNDIYECMHPKVVQCRKYLNWTSAIDFAIKSNGIHTQTHVQCAHIHAYEYTKKCQKQQRKKMQQK